MNKTETIKPLTSLRFLFALMVFLSHLAWVRNEKFQYLFNKIFYEGYLGVSFFFVLSGFVLALNYKGRELDPKQFYIARFARIYPVYILTVAMVLPLELIHRSVDSSDWFIKFVLNMLCMQSFVPDMNYYFSFNSPGWSISTEFFFYLVFPIIITVNNIYTKLFFLVFGLFILFSMKFFNRDLVHPLFYINPFIRIVDFFIGISICGIFSNVKPRFSKTVYSLLELLSILVFVLFFYFHEDVGPGYRYSVYYWVPVACIIFIFAYQKGVMSDAISNKFFITLGEISFSFYLVHQIIMRYYDYLIKEKGLSVSIDEIYVALIIFTLSLLVSYILYKYVEMPCNKAIRGLYKARAGVMRTSAIQ